MEALVRELDKTIEHCSSQIYALSCLLDTTIKEKNRILEQKLHSHVKKHESKANTYIGKPKSRVSNVNDDNNKNPNPEQDMEAILNSQDKETERIRNLMNSRRQQQIDAEKMINDLEKEKQDMIMAGLSPDQIDATINKRQREILNTKYPVPQAQILAEQKMREINEQEEADDISASEQLSKITAGLSEIKQRIMGETSDEEVVNSTHVNLDKYKSKSIPSPTHRK